MSINNNFSKLCNLESVEFIAGTDFTFEITIIDSDGLPVDIQSSTSITMYFSYFGINEELFNVVCNITGVNVFTCNLSSALTQTLTPSTLIYQPVIIDSQGNTFKIGQGEITLLPSII